MNDFNSLYLNKILPNLKKIEKDRKRFEKKLLIVLAFSIIIIVPSTLILVFLTDRPESVYIFHLLWLIPFPSTILLSGSYRKYATKYKTTVIKDIFMHFFEDYDYQSNNRLDEVELWKSNLISKNLNYILKYEDNINLILDGRKVSFFELQIKNIENGSNATMFKGIVGVISPKEHNSENLIFRNQEIFEYNEKELNELIMYNEKTISIYSGNIIAIERFKDLIQILKKYNTSMVFIEGKILFMMQINTTTNNETLDLFEPIIANKVDSIHTYKNCKIAFYRVFRIYDFMNELIKINVA
jgi:hypothetical protein